MQAVMHLEWEKEEKHVALLKAPTRQPKTTTLQVRLEEEVRHNLDRYAEFIDANPSYVVSEALKLLFRKDDEFKRWAGQHTKVHNQNQTQGEALTKTPNNHEVPSNPIRCAQEPRLARSAWLAPLSRFFVVEVWKPDSKFARGHAIVATVPSGRETRYASCEGHRGRSKKRNAR
jgi:predicted transcriptional regulator